jgi:hypothetical protein
MVHGDLIGIQNVTHPGRVIRLSLDTGGHRIRAVHTLLSHHQVLMTDPTTAAVAGTVLRVLTRTGVSTFTGADESSKANKPQPATLIDIALSTPTATSAAPPGSRGD